MAQIIKEITVDVARKNLFQAIVAKQHDSNSRFLKVSFTNEGEPITIGSASSVIINAERADNESKSFAGSVNDDGTVTVPLTNWMLELDDFLRCDISIVAADDSKLTSTSFTIEVEAAANGEGSDISEDENYDILITLLSDCAKAKSDCEDATNSANTAAALANDKASLAQTATDRANEVADNLNAVMEEANTSLEEMETATENAVKAKADAETATSNANTATSNANTAADAANNAADRVGDMLQAQNVSYDNSDSGLDAGDVKAAVDELAKKIGGVANIVVESWEDVQKIVRMGLASNTFAIGDQLTCQRGSTTLVWDIIGIDHDTPTDKNFKHSLTLQLHDCLAGVQFDAREALFYIENGLAAGTYNFTVKQHSWVSTDVGKTFQFTLTQPIPAGGQIVLLSTYNVAIAGTTVKTYASSTTTTEIEVATVSEGSEGTSLGDVNNSINGNTNSLQRGLLGNNRYSQSAIKQYLDSDGAAGSFWNPQNIFDRPPSWVASQAGFQKDMDVDFLAVLGEVDKITALNTVSDGGGSETSAEKFFLLSRTEVYGGKEGSISEGNAYPYYSETSDLSAAGTGADTNRIKYRNGAAQYWWLRSPLTSGSYYVRGVNPTGDVGNYGAGYSGGVVPACCII